MTCAITVRGKVRGVGFRAAMREWARMHHLYGTVQNISSGVRVIVQGKYEDIRECVAWCSHGPSGARVDAVSVQKISEGEFDDFLIIA